MSIKRTDHQPVNIDGDAYQRLVESSGKPVPTTAAIVEQRRAADQRRGYSATEIMQMLNAQRDRLAAATPDQPATDAADEQQK